MSDARKQRSEKQGDPPELQQEGEKGMTRQAGGKAGRENVPAAQWQQVIHLGERLLAVHSGKYPVVDDIQAQRELIAETTQKLVPGEVSIWLSRELLPIFAGRPSNHTPVNETLFPSEPDTPLMRRVLTSRQACFSTTSASDDCHENGWRRTAVRAVACPIKTMNPGQQGTILGVLQVERADGPPFKKLEVNLLDGLAVQAAIALQADRQMAIERWRVEQLALVRKVSAQIANVRDLDELSRRVTRLILETFDYYYVAIFTLATGEDHLRFRASAGPAGSGIGRSEALVSLPVIRLGEGMTGYSAQTGMEVLANEVSQESHYRYIDALPETRSEVVLPLKIEDRVLGVLDVQSDQVNDFQEIDMLVLRALAGSIAIAIEGASLYEALRRRAEQLSAIYEVSNAITSILDLETLLSEVVELIHRSFGYPFIHIFTVHPGRRKIFYETGTGPGSRSFHEAGFAYDLDDPQGMIPWVARQGETILANDVEQEPRYRPSALPPDETRSELTVPLIFGGEVLGVLDVQSDRLHAFGEEDRFLFEALADNIAVAMRNAVLYRSESWRRQAADSLREVAGLLSADVDLDHVLEAILKELERNLPCDLAAIWLIDNEPVEDDPEQRPPLRLAAVRGESAAALNLQAGLDLFDFSRDTGEDNWDPSSSLLFQALESDQPIIRSAAESYEPLGSALDFPGDYSAIAAPLRVGEQPLGVLSLVHHLNGRYGTESRAMTAAFASYAAVAIENTRLYEAAHEQAWVSTVLLQVADATQSITNLNELLATVIRITPMLVGVKSCALYILDEDESFVPAAASGLSRDQQDEFERWRFAAGDIPALDQLLETHQPVLLQDRFQASHLFNIFSGDANALYLENDMLMLVPLLTRGEVLGAFIVDYSHGPVGRNLSETTFDERLAIIQGIAHQTAMAVENIRLLKSQKEEAYVSVALLQVAQAVVSTNDLNEILSSIVRITPILVGMKRVLVFLWEDEHGYFQLVQGYGIPRSAEGEIFATGEFPLLDETLEQDKLIVHPLTIDLSSGDVPEAWTGLVPPDGESIEAYLREEPCLLIALPLSIKGEVLGVMLVEEPDAAPIDLLSGRSANQRMREKRLEIATGISQQAALAIQNDLLQREMVERERLEQEMQLARQIQRTFLPREMPHLDGWELNVRWRTAREVGGDFYDFFELPGGRLGLVIADVADKGMPAALFMVLIRTLVRATVQEIPSPAEVLERVNDVLVPDAHQGMFVTLFYAVIDLNTGEMVYANAGHNPPMLLDRQAGTVERLLKSGMALGVLEGNQVVERRVEIELGDYLVLYTDGVTDSFAPGGAMYGEERLRATIVNLLHENTVDNDVTAGALLDAIETSTNSFIEGQALGDDFTLMILKREN